MTTSFAAILRQQAAAKQATQQAALQALLDKINAAKTGSISTNTAGTATAAGATSTATTSATGTTSTTGTTVGKAVETSAETAAVNTGKSTAASAAANTVANAAANATNSAASTKTADQLKSELVSALKNTTGAATKTGGSTVLQQIAQRIHDNNNNNSAPSTQYFMGQDGTMYKTVNGVTTALTEKEMNPTGRAQLTHVNEEAATPAAATTTVTTAVNNKLVGGNTNSAATGSYYDVDTALNDVYSKAQKAGISITKPAAYGSKITDAKQAQKIIDDYTAQANDMISKAAASGASAATAYWDISSQLNDIQNTSKSYGVTITPPSQTQYSSQAQAQAALDTYAATTQKAMDAAWERQPTTIYDADGRQQAATNKQAQMMIDAQAKWGNDLHTYNVIPEEVANGGNNWWINDQGFYEWAPTTASDKAHLDQINLERSRSGLSPWTTLQLSSAHTELYEQTVNAPGGSHAGKFTPTTSGELKIAKMNAASPINNSASASKSTANTSAKLSIVAAPTVSTKTNISGSSAATKATPVISVSDKKIVPGTDTQINAKAELVSVKSPTTKELMSINSQTKQTEKATIISNPAVTKSTPITTGTSALAQYNRVAAKTTPVTTTESPTVISVNDKKTVPGTGTQTKTTAELLGINSQTKQSTPTIISKPVEETQPTTRVENGHTIYTAPVDYIKQVNAEYAQKIAGTLAAPASDVETGNPNYLKALHNERAEIAHQAEIRDAFAKNPLLDAQGKAINQITTNSGDAVISLNSINHGAKIITPVVVGGKSENYSRGGVASAQVTLQAQHIIDTNPLSITGAGLRTQEQRVTLLSTPITPTTFTGIKPFKTVTDLALDEFRKQHPGAIGQTVAALYDGSKDISSVKKSLNTIDAVAAAHTTQKVLPSLDTFVEKRDQALSSIAIPGTGKTARDYHQQVQGEIKKNAAANGFQSFIEGEYTSVRDRPVTYAGELAAMYAGGAILGGATKIATTGSRMGMLKVADRLAESAPKMVSKSQTAAKLATRGSSALLTGSKLVEPVATVAFTGDIALNAIGEAQKGNWAGVAETGKSLLIGGMGYKKGAELAGKISQVKSADVKLLDTPSYKVSDMAPGVRSAKITEVAGSKRNEIEYGKTITIGNKPLVTVVSTPGSRGISLGAAAAPENLLAGKQFQPFSKLQTNLFKKTVAVRGGSTESQYLENALGMEKAITAMRKPLYVPENFEITSYAIPEAAKPALINGITSYQGDITVTGSVPMKAQASGYVTRETHDLEIYGDNASSIATHLGESLTKNGLQAGKDYQINGTKIEFPATKGSGWDTGVEIFTHSGTPEIPTKTKKLTEGQESPEPKASGGSSEIAFGYESMSPLKINAGGGKKINTQQLAEQLTRKVAGSTFLSENKLQPEHPGRYKDIRDTITIGAAYGSKGKLPIERQVVEFTNAAYKKFDNIEEVHGLTGETMRPFNEIREDPVVDFIHRYQRLPTEAELNFEKFSWKKNKNGKYDLINNENGEAVKIDISKAEMEASKKASVGIAETRTDLDKNSVLYSSEYAGRRASRSPSPARVTPISPGRWLTSTSPSPIKAKSGSADPFSRSAKPSMISPKPVRGSTKPSMISPSPFSSNPFSSKPNSSSNPSSRSISPRSISPDSSHYNPSLISMSPNPISPRPSQKSLTPSPVSPSPAPSKGGISPKPSPKPSQSPSPSPSPKPNPSPSPSPKPSPSPSPSPSPKPSPSPSPIPGSSSAFSRKPTGGWRQPPYIERGEKEPNNPARQNRVRVSKRQRSDKLVSTTKVLTFADMLGAKNNKLGL